MRSAMVRAAKRRGPYVASLSAAVTCGFFNSQFSTGAGWKPAYIYTPSYRSAQTWSMQSMQNVI